MSAIDVEKLTKEISADSPCGDDLEYDAAFVALTTAAQGKPEQQVGSSVIPAEDPEWKEIKRLATELLGRTKDLRVTVHLVRALAWTDGLGGFRDGLALLRGLLEKYWEPIHPKLDPSDGNDPTLRTNTLVQLADRETTIRGVREAPLFSAAAVGKIGLRHFEVANGAAPKAATDKTPPLSAIEGAFMDTNVTELEATAAAVRQAMEHLKGIEAAVASKVQASQTPDLKPLATTLKAADTVLSGQLAKRGVGAGDGAAQPGAAPGAKPAAKPIAGEIGSREDVVRVLDKACEYFDRHEPSSPVPLLLRRAKRLVSMSFMQALQDLAPTGVKEASVIAGGAEKAGAAPAKPAVVDKGDT